ncbi:MAG TPA: hypothetical protein PLM98_01170 [Thiolinea sp.]|nr:hypothetical protein [Thiolinea sp.]
MIANTLKKQAALVTGLFLSLAAHAYAANSTEAWFYNGKLTTPADSRAVLKPYQYSNSQVQVLAKNPAFKQWPWVKQQQLHKSLRSTQAPYLAPKNHQVKALPFWPELKAK